MKSLRRWTSSITSSFDWLVSQVENHESLVNSAIKEVREAHARARVQLKRVQKDGNEMRRKLTELHDAEELWKERAKQIAQTDEERALECIKRRKRIEREISELEVQQREHSNLEKQLGEDLKQIDKRLEQLTQQRNLLRTRQSRAEALGTVRQDDSSLLSEIDDIFERWDTKVTEYEIHACCETEECDDLEDNFTKEEERKELKDELENLLRDAASRDA